MSRFKPGKARLSLAKAISPPRIDRRADGRRPHVHPLAAEIVDGDAPERLMSAARAALLLGVTLRTLSNWEKAGLLIPVRWNRRRYYRVSDVQKLFHESDG